MSEILSEELVHIVEAARNFYRTTHPGSCDKQRNAAVNDVILLASSHRALLADCRWAMNKLKYDDDPAMRGRAQAWLDAHKERT
jgi:hypothetical protein